MRGTIYTCTVQSGRHNYQITDLHRTVKSSIQWNEEGGAECCSLYHGGMLHWNTHYVHL